MNNLKNLIRNVPDFPKEGIGFKDITTLLKNPDGFKESVRQMWEPFKDDGVQKIAGIESRGFIFGAAMAYEHGIGFIPFRKPGKLPAETVSESYELEYGTDSVEMHIDAVQKGERVLIVDDLLATGGTAAACCNLVEKLGGVVVGLSLLIELSFIPGREKLGGRKINVLIDYDSE
ncbi:adenine phosphoribosyltransferase [candidate division LCP-89 bacterium B3_LCP]|uniref:Adenine phosphoribosyltransferase n=1 Tax=candidate division LCP-89 bacterium B3_LCP TaxID=2012998 RepID=A0A532V578_UNCL8|nr:MAG: adenine phosphoribosyltransferase [candidate division LCP-89 bacterium B3_LCP]